MRWVSHVLALSCAASFLLSSFQKTYFGYFANNVDPDQMLAGQYIHCFVRVIGIHMLKIASNNNYNSMFKLDLCCKQAKTFQSFIQLFGPRPVFGVETPSKA